MAIGSISQDAGVGRAGAVVRQFGDDDAYAVRTAVESEGRGRFETHLSKGISNDFAILTLRGHQRIRHRTCRSLQCPSWQ